MIKTIILSKYSMFLKINYNLIDININGNIQGPFNPASKEFEKLLNNQFTKNTIEEGKVIEGKINKITEKFVFYL